MAHRIQKRAGTKRDDDGRAQHDDELKFLGIEIETPDTRRMAPVDADQAYHRHEHTEKESDPGDKQAVRSG